MSFLTTVSIRNRLIVALATLTVIGLGVIAIGALKQELTPSIQAPTASITAQSAGLAPEEMANNVTAHLEQAVSAVPGVRSVTSTTSSGDAQILVEWTAGDDDGAVLRAVRDASDAVAPSLPPGTEVNVTAGSTDGMPAMVLSAASRHDAPAFGDALAQTAVPALQAVQGVQLVALTGQETQRVTIDLRPADVQRLGVDPAAIAPALEAHGQVLPAGQADASAGPLAITVGSPLTSLADLQQLPIPTADGAAALAEFADVATETVPPETISRVDGKPALTLTVFPAPGANVVDISHAVTAELTHLTTTLDAQFDVLSDQAPAIEQSIHDLSIEGALGLLFAVLVILAFLRSWRSTLIAAVSIPVSLLVTLIGLWWSGNTLNILTLGALTIAVGRVVDDSIVVIENLSRRRENGPLTPSDVVASVRQVSGAILASTLTTVAVFLPIAFVTGVTGQLFRPFAVTVTIALLASLVVSLTIVPTLASWFLRRPATSRAPVEPSAPATDSAPVGNSTPGGPALRALPAAVPLTPGDVRAPVGLPAANPLAPGDARASGTPAHHDLGSAPDRLQRWFLPAMSTTRRHPVLTLTAAGAVLALTLVATPFLSFGFLGSSGSETLELEQTPKKSGDLVAVAEPVEKALAGVDGVTGVRTAIRPAAVGTPASIQYGVQLKPGLDPDAVEARIRRTLGTLPDPDSVQVTAAAPDGEPVADDGHPTVVLQGDDDAALRTASELLTKRIATVEGVQSVQSDLTGEQSVMHVEIDEPLAARLGFDRATIATAVTDALEGARVGTLMLDGRTQDIVMRTPGTARPADRLGEILLPVTARQTAQAQQEASAALEAKAKAEAEAARTQAEHDLAAQIDDASRQRAELVTQVDALTAQLDELAAAPLPAPEDLDRKAEAHRRAQEERDRQLAALEDAVASAQSSIAGIDEQVRALRQSSAEAAAQQSEADAAVAAQQAALAVTGTPVPLSAVASVTEEPTAPVVLRADRHREVTLTVTPKAGAEGDLAALVDRAARGVDLPTGVTMSPPGAATQQAEAFGQLGMSMLTAILLVLVVMIATFRSLRGPLVLLVSIPFAATGAVFALLLTGTPLGLPALIGLLMLIGIVVTNAIVLLDLVSRFRSAGATLDEAVEHGTRLRLRPILMTAAATVFALLPMALGLTGDGVFISQPLAVVVIGGLVSSTVLTLIVVPVLYTIVERAHERRGRRRADRQARRERRA